MNDFLKNLQNALDGDDNGSNVVQKILNTEIISNNIIHGYNLDEISEMVEKRTNDNKKVLTEDEMLEIKLKYEKDEEENAKKFELNRLIAIFESYYTEIHLLRESIDAFISNNSLENNDSPIIKNYIKFFTENLKLFTEYESEIFKSGVTKNM